MVDHAQPQERRIEQAGLANDSLERENQQKEQGRQDNEPLPSSLQPFLECRARQGARRSVVAQRRCHKYLSRSMRSLKRKPPKPARIARARNDHGRQRPRLIDACISALHIYGPSRTTVEKVVALDRKSTRLNSSHSSISYAVF